MNHGERIKEERERLGYSQTAFAAIGDSSKGSQISWEKGTASPNVQVLAAWASVGADILYIVMGERSASTLKPDEQMLLEGYRQMDIRGKAGVLAFIGGLGGTIQPAPGSIIVNGEAHQVAGRDIRHYNDNPVNKRKGKKDG